MRYLLPGVVAAMLTFAIGTVATPSAAGKGARAASSVSLHLSRHSVVRGDRLSVRGRVRPAAAGRRRVKLVMRGPRDGLIMLRTKPSGAFALHWSVRRNGSYRLAAYAVHGRRWRAARSPVRRFSAYDAAVASYYGPGLYGGALACGGTLEPGTLGVANKTLPCGAKVRLRYGGHSLVVPVVDRGPYAAGRDFDLTEATKQRLGFPDLGVLLFSRAG